MTQSRQTATKLFSIDRVILATLLVALIIGFFGIQYLKSVNNSDSGPNRVDNKAYTFSHHASEDISFSSFRLEYPANMTLFVNNNQIMDTDYSDKSQNLFLRLDKGSSSMEIISASMGGGGCLYPGDPDQEGPLARYGEYTTLRTDSGYWRRSKSLNPPSSEDSRAIYTICSNMDEVGVFSSTTPVGGIVYKIEPGEESYIIDFDEIVRSIDIMKK